MVPEPPSNLIIRLVSAIVTTLDAQEPSNRQLHLPSIRPLPVLSHRPSVLPSRSSWLLPTSARSFTSHHDSTTQFQYFGTCVASEVTPPATKHPRARALLQPLESLIFHPDQLRHHRTYYAPSFDQTVTTLRHGTIPRSTHCSSLRLLAPELRDEVPRSAGDDG